MYVGMSTSYYSVVVLGAGGVGKSALTARFMKDVFLEGYDPTIEERYVRDVVVDNKVAPLEVFDTAGTDQFKSLDELYITSGTGFILVFSLTQEASLKELESIRSLLFRIKGSDENLPVVVVGTKLDLTTEREVTRARIQSLATEWGHSFYETSAKRNWHVSDVFEDLVRQMRAIHPTPPVRRRPEKKKHHKCVVM